MQVNLKTIHALIIHKSATTLSMKPLIIILVLLIVQLSVFAQISDSLGTEKELREKVLSDIQVSLDKKTRSIDSTVLRLDQKVNDLDKSIIETNNVREKADKLLERVQALEDKQKALEQNELIVFEANYQSAIVNLLYMDREIKPVILFESTKEFFGLLSDVTNPTTYPDYNEWYLKFHDYIERNKNKEPTLDVLIKLMDVTGTAAGNIPLGGPMTTLFFTGIDDYIKTLSKKQHQLKEQSENMFQLITKLSQFDHDKGAIEQDWELITKELDELHIHYEMILNQNLKTLGITPADFNEHFTHENDADKRYSYITGVRKKASELVASQKETNPKDWKENIYYSLMDIQSIKLRFGNITFRLQAYIDKYESLLKEYSKDPAMGIKMTVLQKKLNELKDIFENAFNPMDYINSTTRMYKVV
jgi:hypothetical protein